MKIQKSPILENGLMGNKMSNEELNKSDIKTKWF